MGVIMHDHNKEHYKEGVPEGSQNQQMCSSSSLPPTKYKKLQCLVVESIF